MTVAILAWTLCGPIQPLAVSRASASHARTLTLVIDPVHGVLLFLPVAWPSVRTCRRPKKRC